ncbi:ABC transporter substrate-binding protein [Roseomonas sp. SSH11]|uniref:ABC transporter substrate-binding protein n=2 Tax=Pararoseomonas baculiformis TaxID=2820812 RepID=A0ABS4AI94_9PROT|nr:ABC transporter substrate-binding protein [Pararoseomonas baculiformis]MBP0446752.1 ABC transporter substrate-binding protein [Pararoseomonas baculiformis]
MAAISGGFAPLTAEAQTAAVSGNGTLTIGIGGAVTSVDPHFYNASPNNGLAMHIFDRLVERDAQARLQPGLALSWTPVSETVWEFKLRPGVKWHDGRDFTAEDVAFTVERAPNVPNSPGGFGGFVRSIKRVEIVDPLTVRFHTERPAPLVPTDLASVAIIAKHVNGTATEDYNSGKAAIGTGPYKLVSYTPGDRTELARNDAWFGPKQPWARVSYRFIGNDSGRVAALLAGDVDMIDQVPTSDITRLRRDNRVKVVETQGLRVIYLFPDYSREGAPNFATDLNGQKLTKNPFRDLRFRQALSAAINREALCRQIMEGTAQPTGQWLAPGTYSHNPEVKPDTYNPERAKALLAEAGFPQGLKLTLHGPNDRYPNDSRIIQAVAQMWQRIGIQTSVEAAPWASFSARNARQEFDIRLLGWASTTGEAAYTLVNILSTYDQAARLGANNNGRYSNPRLDEVTARATSTLDDGEREKLLQQGVKIAMDDLAFIPLMQLVNVWAVKRGLDYNARADERSVAMEAKPA